MKHVGSWRPAPDYGRPEPMPAAGQLASARAQLEGLTPDELAGARWAIHPRDLAALREAVGDAEVVLGLWLIIAADPALEGQDTQLAWETSG